MGTLLILISLQAKHRKFPKLILRYEGHWLRVCDNLCSCDFVVEIDLVHTLYEMLNRVDENSNFLVFKCYVV